MKKAVLVRNAVETLGYFSMQLAEALKRHGVEIYWIDYDRMDESLDGLGRFAGLRDTTFITFNFIGISGEDVFAWDADARSGGFAVQPCSRTAASDSKEGRESAPFSGDEGAGLANRAPEETIWEHYAMRYVNILVDHPMYFHTKLVRAPEEMRLFCIDREHVRYVRRFYPGICVEFLPIAGNGPVPDASDVDFCPYEKRRYDLVFTANYVPSAGLIARFGVQGPEYGAFYRGIYEELIAEPGRSVDDVMERHIREELGDLPGDELRSAMAGMAVIDLCVRAYYRERILAALTEADIRVHVFGADWERMPCKKPRNLICNGGQVDSAACVRAVREARLALNILPWFQDGAHDRVFTAMLQKTAVISDRNCYLEEQFADGEDIAFFSLKEIGALPERILRLLADGEHLAGMAERGYRKVRERHTWAERADVIRQFLITDMRIML